MQAAAVTAGSIPHDGTGSGVHHWQDHSGRDGRAGYVARVRVTVVSPAQVVEAEHPSQGSPNLLKSADSSDDSDAVVESAVSREAPSHNSRRQNHRNGVGLGSSRWRGAVSGAPWRLSGILSDVGSSSPAAHRPGCTGSDRVTVFVSARHGVDSVHCGVASMTATTDTGPEWPKSLPAVPCRTLTQALANAHRCTGSCSGALDGSDCVGRVDGDVSAPTPREDRAPPSSSPSPPAVARQVLLQLATGYYDSTSCGIFTNAPLSIIGNGSDVTVIDCQHKQVLLLPGRTCSVCCP